MSTDEEIGLRIQKEKEQQAVIEDEIYKILMGLRNGEKIDFSRLGDPVFDKAVEECVSLGYVTGVYPQRVMTGRLVVDIAGKAEITDPGERFTYYRNQQNR